MAVVEGVVVLLSPRAQDNSVQIALDVNEAVVPLRIGDTDRIRQILLNLAGNASKFTQGSGVSVILFQIECILVLGIEDTGPGIPEEHIPVLLKEFSRAKAARAAAMRVQGSASPAPGGSSTT